MIGDQDTDAALLQVTDDLLDIEHRNRIDPGERFIEQNEFRVKDQRPGYLDAPAFTAGQGIAKRFCDMRQTEIFKQLVFALLLNRL